MELLVAHWNVASSVPSHAGLLARTRAITATCRTSKEPGLAAVIRWPNRSITAKHKLQYCEGLRFTDTTFCL